MCQRTRHTLPCASAKRCKSQSRVQCIVLNLLWLPPLNPTFYRDEHLFVDLRDRVVTLDSETVTLTRDEYRVMALLAQHAGEVVPRPTLSMRIRGHMPEMGRRKLDAHIHRLRRRLGVYADQYIETVYGTGYRFRPIPGR